MAKPEPSTVRRMTLLPGLVLASFLSVPGALAETPLSVTYSLDTPVASLGEPVLLSLNARNDSSEPATLELGKNDIGNFVVSFEGPGGTRGQSLRIQPGGFASSGSVAIQPGGTYSKRLVLNRWVDFRLPGKYAIHVKLVSAEQNTTSLSSFSGTLEVLAYDPQRLRKVCGELAEQVAASDSYQDALEAMLPLTFVHDPIAVPYIGRAVHASPLVTQPAVAALEQIANEEAIQTLATLLHDKRYPDGPMLARAALERIQSTTPLASRKQLIQQLLSSQQGDSR